MSFSRCFIVIAALLFIGLPDASFAAQQTHRAGSMVTKSVRGTWYSAHGSVTFKSNGTVNFKGKRYHYAVSNGGLIQLTGKNSSYAIPYTLAGGKLTLTVDGNTTVYTRKRPKKK